MRPNQTAFFNLGFLIPFSTIFNGILKNVFQISRPAEELWLVLPTDGLGFPSGDVQVATVFWGMLLLNARSIYLKSLIGILLFGIACSWVYLGVHSLDDVCAGLLIGIITLIIWRRPIIEKITSGWRNGRTHSLFFVTILTIIAYLLITKEARWPAMIVMSMGASIGLLFPQV
jgi:membrane-associated phospholipid phosphatase